MAEPCGPQGSWFVASKTFISKSLTLFTYAFALSARFFILLCAPGTYLQQEQLQSGSAEAAVHAAHDKHDCKAGVTYTVKLPQLLFALA